MKETSIIMSGDHPKLILDGIKTMTRRTWGLEKINEDPNLWRDPFFDDVTGYWNFWQVNTGDVLSAKCPYGQVGDLLWVKEVWAEQGGDIYYKADWGATKPVNMVYDNIKWRSPYFMFRWASRITREVTELRAERLQSITEEDAIAEGVNGYLAEKFKYGELYRVFEPYHKEYYPLVDHADIGDIVRFQGPNMGFACFQSKNPKCLGGTLNIDGKIAFNYVGIVEPDYRNGFRILWDSLNAKRGYSWDKNPWVWPIGFKDNKQ